MTALRAAVLAVPLVFSVDPAGAQPVTLTSPGGSVEITGRLLSYDGAFYRVDSDFGVLTLDGAGVTCTGSGCPDPADFVAEVTFAGARSMGAVLLPGLVEGFAVRNGFALARREEGPGRYVYVLSDRADGRVAGRFHFRLSGPAEGFADLLTEDADLVLSTREVAPAEAALAREAGIGDLTTARHARIVGLDALVPLRHVANPIRAIGMGDLARVLAGEIDNWADLGGPDAPIALHLPAGELGFDDRIARVILGPRRARLAAGIVRHDSASGLAAAVAADPFALGIGLYSQRGNTEALPLRGSCGAMAVAGPRSLKTEDYPLTAPMFLYSPARRLPRIARDFLAYLTSPAAQPVVRRAGFVDQFPQGVPIDAQGLRLAAAILSAGEDVGLADLQQMVAALSGMRRLTLTFRFAGGSAEPDAQSRSNIRFLAELLDRGMFDGRRLLFAGFSDGQGPAATNRRLSLARARAVRDAVAAAVGRADHRRLRLEVAGFGEALPMACDDTAWGRGINRRVEVWTD